MENNAHNIYVSKLCKNYGKKEVLKDVTFEAHQGRVTVFLGPNGAGKSSTLRIILGLDFPSSGVATFAKMSYRELVNPLQVVGTVFDGVGGVASRKVKTHLHMIARSNNIPVKRVNEVLSIVGLLNQRDSKLGSLSLGEGQRLGLATALLGNPQYLILDEPMNGLDPSGIRWFREFICEQAKQGKTILLSSHLLLEVQMIADDIVIINQGKIVATGSIETINNSIQTLEDVYFSLTEGRSE